MTDKTIKYLKYLTNLPRFNVSSKKVNGGRVKITVREVTAAIGAVAAAQNVHADKWYRENRLVAALTNNDDYAVVFTVEFALNV